MSAKPISISDRTRSRLSKTSELQRQYVVARGTMVGSKLQALDQTVDDVTRLNGYKVYEDMLHDPHVAAAYWYLVYSILADKLTIRPRVQKADDRNFALATEISDFLNFNIDNLGTPFRDTLEQMMEFMAFGHKVSEVTYRIDTWNGRARLVLDGITVLPHPVTAFVVDVYMRVHGLIARRAVAGMTTLSTIVSPENIISREKFFILTMRARNNDPRGNSIFRPAFNGYNFKRQTWPEYLLWLMNKAVPLLFGFTAEDAKEEKRLDADGVEVLDEYGEASYVSAQEAMLAVIERQRNSGGGVFPHGSWVEAIETKGVGEPFDKAITVSGEEITRAILLQTLATLDAQHQTKGSTSTQMSIPEMLIWALKGIVVNGIINDLFKPLVRYNYGEQAAQTLMPICSLGDNDRRSWAVDATGGASILPYCTAGEAIQLKSEMGIHADDSETGEMIGRLGAASGVPAPIPEPVPMPALQ